MNWFMRNDMKGIVGKDLHQNNYFAAMGYKSNMYSYSHQCMCYIGIFHGVKTCVVFISNCDFEFDFQSWHIETEAKWPPFRKR